MTSQLFLTILFVVLQNNQASVPATEKPAEKQECQVVGVVVRQDGGEPIKNARVVLKPEGTGSDVKRYGLKTGEDGKFCFSNVTPGRYRLAAERNGYVTQMYGGDEAWSQGAVLTVAKGQKLEKILLRLIRAGVISGKVLDADGEPASGILVQALLAADSLEPLLEEEGRATTGMAKNGLVPVQNTVTNDLGAYRLAGLPPEEYFVNAVDTGSRINVLSLTGDMLVERDDDENLDKYAPTFYPGVTRQQQAQQVLLKAGSEVSADIQLQHEKMVTVSGTVVREDGKPAAATTVSLSNGDLLSSMFSTPMAQTDASGHFSIKHVLAGSYTVNATSFGLENVPQKLDISQILNARQKIEVGEQDVNNLRLVLGRGLTVSGKVSVDGGTPPKFPDLYASFVGKDDDTSGGNGSVDKDGNFLVTGLEATTYQVGFISLPEGHYLKRVTYNGQAVPDHLIALEPGAPTSKVELVVSPHAATITGTVEDSDHAPLGGVTVVLRNDPDKGKIMDIPGSATTDQNGKFFFRGLAPGPYTVVAKRRRKAGSPPGSSETSVKVSEDEQKAITMKLETSSSQ
jgi:hypothetical protein